MDKNLKNVLILIVVLIGVYYFISPYENCLRNYQYSGSRAGDTPGGLNMCNRITKW